MSPLELWLPSPRDIALALVATVLPLLTGPTLAASSNLRPKTLKRSPEQGDRRFMYGFTNPQDPDPSGSNALVLIHPLSAGTQGSTELVRGLGTGLSGCEIFCVRKTTALQNPLSPSILMTTNEITQHGRIQSEITNDIFFPRLLGHRESSWPGRWPRERLPSETPHAVEMYQEFIHGRTLYRITANTAPLEKEDVMSAYAFAMKHTIVAMERLSALDPPLEHNDLNAHNIMIGWIGDETPSITENSLGEMRAYLIDYGLTSESHSNPRLRLEADFKAMRITIGEALRDLGVRPSTADMRSSHAQHALQLAWHLLWETSMVTDGDQRVKALGKLREVFDDDVTEKYSEGFRQWFPEMYDDPHAEPRMYVSKAELIAKAGLNRAAGPWHPIEVEYRDGKWEAIRFFQELWCDWDECVESSLNKAQST